jgi:hypothetical protein
MGRMGEEKVIEEDVDEIDVDETGNTDSKKEAEIKIEGQNLYSALHLLYYTGFYRILPSFDFRTELKVGYNIEVFVSLIPMLFCQVFNNYDTDGDVSFVQKAALWMKLACILVLILELALMIVEVKKKKEMKELNIGLPELSEEDRRSKYGKFMAYVAFIIMGLFMILLVIGIAS